MPDRRPPHLTLANWDLGGESSAWAYLHADELFPSAKIAPPSQPVELDHAELAGIARYPVQPGRGAGLKHPPSCVISGTIKPATPNRRTLGRSPG
jgi:hypothetical protein